MNYTYPAKVEVDEEGFYLVKFPDVPGAATDGRTLEEALGEASDCLEEAIAGMIRRGEAIPKPSRFPRRGYAIPLPAVMAAKAALYEAVRDSGIPKVELAKRLKCDEKEVRRLMDPRHTSKFERIEAALAALGKRLSIHVNDAA